jgi:hypothetical protein
VIRDVDVRSGDGEVLAVVPAAIAPGAFARLSYSPCGRYVLLSGTRAGALLDLDARVWAQLPLAAADWAPERGPGWLVGTDHTDTGAKSDALKVGWFDLTTWTADPLGTVIRPDVCTGGFFQLDLSADGRFLAGVTRLEAVDHDPPTSNSYRTGVIDLRDLTLDVLTIGDYDGVAGAVREQRSPRWVRRPTRTNQTFTLADAAALTAAEAPSGDVLDGEFADEFEALSEGYFIAATHPGHPGTCSQEARLFTRRAMQLAGPRPWLQARLELLPGPSPAEPADLLWRGDPTVSLDAAIRTARAACALADEATHDALVEWRATLRSDPANQEATLHLHQLEAHDSSPATAAEALGHAAAGADHRLAIEARLRRAYLIADSGGDASTELADLAACDDPWFAARAQPLAAQDHLQHGRTVEARSLLIRALAGPHEAAARSAAMLGSQAGWGQDPEFVAFRRAAGPQA